jgi:hypothetical protein
MISSEKDGAGDEDEAAPDYFFDIKSGCIWTKV